MEFVSTESAISMIEYLIGFDEVAKGEREDFTYFNSKIFQSYAHLLQKIDEKIKLIFFYEKWAEHETSKKEKLKVEL